MIQTYTASKTCEEALERAARLWGIEPEYTDTWGKRHVTTPEIQRAILAALGVAVSTTEELDRAVEQRLCRDWDRMLPNVLVAGESEWADGVPLAVPAELADATAVVAIRWEDGASESHEIPLRDLNETGRARYCGRDYVRRTLRLPAGARLGYHELEVSVGDGETERRATTRLILCPDRTYAPRLIREGRATAGLAIALYGLRSERNWGCGDFTDLEAFVTWAAADTGVSFIGLNPLHAIPNRQPFNISPYLPSSTLYRNPLYLDLDRIEDFRNSRRAQRWMNRPEIQAEIKALRGAAFVEYERVWALKRTGLKLAFVAFLRDLRSGTPRVRQFREYMEGEGALLDAYATWCALDDWLHRRNPDMWNWPDWPEEFRDPDSFSTRSFAEKYWRLVLFYKYAQWQVDLQLGRTQQTARACGMAIGLFHDLALATDRYGAELWAHRPLYVSGCRVGAPPDNFSPKGQDWSFPPPHAEVHRENGYRLFAESIRKNCRHGGALRIDHVMRFFRLYWIPEGMDPAHGAYVRDSFEDLLHILALESVRQKVMVVGEDLGTVTTQIRQELDHFGIYGYKVPYFEKTDRNEFRRPGQYAEQALVASSTHDLPTLAGFWKGRDIEARRRCRLIDESSSGEHYAERDREKQKLLDALFAEGLLPDWCPRRAADIPELTGELHNAIVGWLARAPSRLLALNQEDLLKELDQQNLPATTSENPNWRRKLRFTVEEFAAGAARDYTTMFRNWLAQSHRLENNGPL
ncbi:MAG TPA: 4-alpha-glucanotransferase [Bryobacteraceae bacterium]|nr:4-alpha-glucanotransferase [Bryobacteraceae bacterium]